MEKLFEALKKCPQGVYVKFRPVNHRFAVSLWDGGELLMTYVSDDCESLIRQVVESMTWRWP